MSLNATNLSLMTNDQLVTVAHAEYNPLTSTDLELELIKRLEIAIDAEDDSVTAAAADVSLIAEDIRALGDAVITNTNITVALLRIVAEAGYDTPEDLKTDLELLTKFRALANDAGDVFARLSDLSQSTTQE
jgi:hypothetical protein